MLIGELAQTSGTTTKTLRFYEDVGLLPTPHRSANGYRYYDNPTDTFARIDFIRRGQTAGLTLAQIRQVLEIRDHGTPPCRHVVDLLDERLAGLDQQLADLHNLRDTVSELRYRVEGISPDSCDPTAICQYL